MDLNIQAIYDSIKQLTTENANVFWLRWIQDAAPIKRMPLLIMLAICGSKPQAVIAILDCTYHMVNARKKILNSSCPISNQRLMSLIQENH